MELINTSNAPKAVGPYSQAYIHQGMLYASGQIPINPETSTVEATDIEGQTERVCKNIEAVLKEAKLGFEDVIKTTCYLSDMGDFAKFNEVYAKYFVGKPARSCVAVKALPMGVLCEIEILAVVS